MEKVKVIIVGAGFAGLTAAKLLHEQKISFILLEARERIGGRVYSKTTEEFGHIELGGQWVGHSQNELYSLLKEYDLNLFPTYNTGKNTVCINNKIKHYSGLIPKIDIPSLINIDYLIKDLNKKATQIDLTEPWKSPKAKQWDSITLAQYISGKSWFTNSTSILNAGLETLFAVNSAEISLLQALFYIRSGKNLDVLLSIDEGAQQHRVSEGMHSLAFKMSQPFQDRIHLNEAVLAIHQDGRETTVMTSSNSYISEKVILTIPPVIIPRIDYDPVLSPLKLQLCQRVPMGLVIKSYAVYSSPFWREDGLSGQVVTDETYPFQTVFDNTEPNGQKGKLLAFIIADRARNMLKYTENERKNIVLEHLASIFGSKALTPLAYYEKCWADEIWSSGCYAGMRIPGAWISYKGVLAKPEGNIHFAGTETADVWNGYIEGAILSAKRVVKEITPFIGNAV